MPAIRTIVREVAAPRTWRQAAYAVTSLGPAVPAFAAALLGLVAGALSLTGVGLPLLALVLWLARSCGSMFRWPARAVLGWDWPAPRPLDVHGAVATVRALLRDATGWRALAYCLVKLPLTMVTVYGVLVAVLVGVTGLTAPLWWLASHDAWGLWPDTTWLDTLGLAAQAVAVVLVFPWFVHFLVGIDQALVRGLLEPTEDVRRIAALERSRTHLVDDAASHLASVERNLHDGTQARLVALGMALARLDRHLDDPATARQIVTTSRRMVDESLAELREIIRGMHPPALDDGLPVALATLASRNPVPTHFHDHLHATPSPAAANVLYFATAELLTNTVRHASATRADITLDETEHEVRLTVTDNGCGGAQLGHAPGTGLDGLRRRAEALDGNLTIDSPPGGPTRVALTLPKRHR